MKCEVCNKEFEGRADARFCSATCRSKAYRATDNATDNKINVATDKVLDTDKIAEKEEIKVDDYYKSEKYLNLIKHLEETPIEKLEEEGIFIPAWKYAGHKKKPNIKELLCTLNA